MGHLHRFPGAPRFFMSWRAARASLGLSVLFMAVYGTCNWITSLRSDVGQLFFQWELLIPFVPVMIIPYMSIDLFFVAGPFLCADREELQLLRRRITLAILAAGACFLAAPLTIGFPRPQPQGFLGLVFNAFLGMDKPFNLLPSLHITLRTILAELYARHTRGGWRVASHVWFSLVGFSTVFTHQHHLVDVAGGFLLAALCFYLVSPAPWRQPVCRNSRVGSYYGAGAVLFCLLAAALRPWGLVLLWPAISLAIVAAAYAGLGPAIFRKHEGRLPLCSRMLLGPVLLGQNLSLRYYERQCRPWDAVADPLLIGRRLTATEAEQAIREGVTAVLDLTGEFSETPPFLRLAYCNVPVLDLTAPDRQQVEKAVAFIQAHEAGGKVYVHCKIGYSRTAAIAGAWLLKTGRAATADEAAAMLRRARPSIVIRPEAAKAITAAAAMYARN